MNIQIFGKSKCFDSKKAERYFKERRIKYQYIDVLKYGMSRGELNAVKNAVGLDAMIDTTDEDYPLIAYLAGTEAKLDKLFEDAYLIKTPIVRNGKQATVGYCPDVWKTWEYKVNDDPVHTNGRGYAEISNLPAGQTVNLYIFDGNLGTTYEQYGVENVSNSRAPIVLIF